MNISNFFKKPSEHKNILRNIESKFKRQLRNRRYYVRHRAEIQQKRKNYYLINGK